MRRLTLGRLAGMFEESVESFITQWRPYAADVTLFPHTEGSPAARVPRCRGYLRCFGTYRPL